MQLKINKIRTKIEIKKKYFGISLEIYFFPYTINFIQKTDLNLWY